MERSAWSFRQQTKILSSLGLEWNKESKNLSSRTTRFLFQERVFHLTNISNEVVIRVMKNILLLFLLGIEMVFAHEGEPQLPFERPHAHHSLRVHSHLGLESHYFSEGRDVLNGHSFSTASLEAGWRHFATGLWYGTDANHDYDEMHLSLAVTQSYGSIDVYGGYTHIRFPIEGGDDNELGFGISYADLPFGLEFSGDLYYSFHENGLFAEGAISKSYELFDALSLQLVSRLGTNHGYVSDGHDGLNHYTVGIGLDYQLNDELSLMAHVTQSWALDRDLVYEGDLLLVDLLHFGIGIQWAF